MSLSFMKQQQLMLLINLETRYQQDEIITRIRQMVKDFKIPGSKGSKSPLRNVLNVATEAAASLEIVKTYIRYQRGRGDDEQIWKKKADNRLFADALNESLDSLSDDVLAIMQRVKGRLDDDEIKEYLQMEKIRLEHDHHLKLAQLYLGYLYREHVAVASQSESNNDSRKPDNSGGSYSKPLTKSPSNRL